MWNKYAAAIIGIEACRYSPPKVACGVATAGLERAGVAKAVRSAVHFDLLRVDLQHLVEGEED
jgi:hypothetical protein